MKRIDSTTQVEDLCRDPAAYGLPTFEQFSAHPDWYRPKHDSFMALDNGPQAIRKLLRKVKYKINGVSVNSLEEVERAIKDHGYTIDDFEFGKPGMTSKLKYKSEMIPQGAGKYDVEIDFLP